MFAIISAFTVLLAVLPSAFAVEDLLPVAFKTAEKVTAQILAKTAKPSNATAAGDYVLLHYFDVKDCSAGKEIQYVAYKTNSCYNNGASGSTRWSCNGDQVHYDQWSSSDCSGATQATNDYSPDKCLNQEAPTSYILSIAFSCSSTYSPPGSWYASTTYTDSTCNSLYMSSLMKNQQCLNLGSYSMRIDYPKEYLYYTSTDCSNASPYEVDLSSTANKCVATTAGATQSMKSYFSQA